MALLKFKVISGFPMNQRILIILFTIRLQV